MSATTSLEKTWNGSVIFNKPIVRYKEGRLRSYPVRNDHKRALMRALQEGRCFYCGVTMTKKGKKRKMSVDHFVPKSKQGSNSVENTVLSCSGCNSTKSDRMPTLEEQIKFEALHDLITMTDYEDTE